MDDHEIAKCVRRNAVSDPEWAKVWALLQLVERFDEFSDRLVGGPVYKGALIEYVEALKVATADISNALYSIGSEIGNLSDEGR